MSRRVNDLQRTDRVALSEEGIDFTRLVPVDADVERKLDVIDLERSLRDERGARRFALARDDVGFRLVCPHLGAAQLLQRRQTADVRPVRVREDNVLQIGNLAAQLLDRPHDLCAVAVVERVDQRERSVIVQQVGVNAPGLALAQRIDALDDLARVA